MHTGGNGGPRPAFAEGRLRPDLFRLLPAARKSITHKFGTREGASHDPRNEHDACGVGFMANIKGRKSHDIIGAACRSWSTSITGARLAPTR